MPAKKKSRAALRFPTIVGRDGLPLTFICGNHHPPHIAKSIKRLLELSQTLGCRKFRVLERPEEAPPTFACGNHEPAHIANSTQEMEDLKNTEGCTNFHVIIP